MVKTRSFVKGDVIQCLMHFLNRVFKQKEEDLIETFKSIVGCSRQTMNRWKNRTQSPIKLSQLKIRYFLLHLGYDVQYTKLEPTELEDLTRLIGTGIVSFKDVSQATGFDEKYVMNIILYDRRCNSEEFLLQVQKFVKSYASRDRDKKNDAGQESSVSQKKLDDATVKTRHESIGKHLTALIGLLFNGNNQASLSDSVACRLLPTEQKKKIVEDKILALIPIMEEIIMSDEISSIDRAKIRKQIGEQELFHASNLLSALCGEHAREKVLESMPNSFKRRKK